MQEADEPRKSAPHVLGMSLDTLSISELTERIGMLEAEIARLRASIEAKTASRAAAESAFKL